MANQIDSYMHSSVEYDGKWYIAKPIPDTRWKQRLKDTLGVLIGKYTAIYFQVDKIKEAE